MTRLARGAKWGAAEGPDDASAADGSRSDARAAMPRPPEARRRKLRRERAVISGSACIECLSRDSGCVTAVILRYSEGSGPLVAEARSFGVPQDDRCRDLQRVGSLLRD